VRIVDHVIKVLSLDADTILQLNFCKLSLYLFNTVSPILKYLSVKNYL